MGQPSGFNRPELPDEHIVWVEGTWGTETSKYPEEDKEISISLVAASETEIAQTNQACLVGVTDQTRGVRKLCFSRTIWKGRPQKVKAL